MSWRWYFAGFLASSPVHRVPAIGNRHLRTLSALNIDQKVLAAIDAVIRELERRIRQSGDGQTEAL
jgi:hypothetical protein